MSKELLDHSLEMLTGCGHLSSRRMFGGYGIYADGLFIAIIFSDMLYLKASISSQAQFAAEGCKLFEYEREGKKASLRFYTAPLDAMDSPDAMKPWARLAIQAALEARAAQKPKSPKSSKAGKMAYSTRKAIGK